MTGANICNNRFIATFTDVQYVRFVAEFFFLPVKRIQLFICFMTR